MPRLSPAFVLHHLAAAVVVAAMLLLPGASALAQSDAERAAELVEEATEFFHQEEYAEAAIRFQEAFNLDPDPVLMFNIARAHQEMGDLPAALEFFEQARSMNPDGPVGGAARERIADLERILTDQGYDPDAVTSADYVPRGDLSILPSPEYADVFLDGEYVGSGATTVERLDAGMYEVRISAEGHYPLTADVEVRGGAAEIRNFTLQPRTSLDEYVPPTPGYVTIIAPMPGMEVLIDGEPWRETPVDAAGLAPGSYVITVRHPDWTTFTTNLQVASGQEARVYARVEPTSETGGGVSRSGVGTGLIVGGGVALVTGGAFGVLALDSASDYRNDPSNPDRADVRDRARSQALIADIGIGVGAGLLVAGIVLKAVDGGGEVDPGTQWRDQLVLSPSFGPRRAGVSLGARW